MKTFSTTYRLVFYITASLLFTHSFYVSGQNSTGINNPNPSPKAALDIKEGTAKQGVLVPRLTASDTTALNSGITATEKGLLFFDVVNNHYWYYNGIRWVAMGKNPLANNNAWLLGGNNPDSTTDYIGTNNFQPIIFKTNNQQRMRIGRGGNVGIGMNANGNSILSVKATGSGQILRLEQSTSTSPVFEFRQTVSNHSRLGMFQADGLQTVQISGGSDLPTYFNSGNNIGIGTTAPQAQLHIQTEAGGSTEATLAIGTFNNTNGGSAVVLIKSGGTTASPSAVAQNNPLGHVLFVGSQSTTSNDYGLGAEIIARVSGKGGFSPTNNGTDLVFSTATFGTNSSTEKMRIFSDGNVNIGVPASITSTYNLALRTNLAFLEAGSAPQYFTTFKAGDQAANLDYTLPLSAPDGFLKNTSGVLSWEPAGGSLSGGAANKVAIWTSASTLSNNTNLHWDNTNNRLGIGVAVPSRTLHVEGDGYLSGNLGVGTAGPARVEIRGVGNTGSTQALRLTNSSITTLFTVDDAGMVTIPALGSPGGIVKATGSGALTTGALSASDLPADGLDYTEFKDAMALDAALSIEQTTYSWSQNYTGATGNAVSLSANNLGGGRALNVISSAATPSGELVNLRFAGTGAGTGTVLNINSSLSGANNKGVNIFHDGNTAGTDYGLYVESSSSGTTNVAGYFNANGATNNYGLIVDKGNVGIGTVTPTNILNVVGTTAVNTALTKFTSNFGTIDFLTSGSNVLNLLPVGSGGKYMFLTHASGPVMAFGSNGVVGWIGTNSNDNLSVVTNSTVRMNITSTGDVGVGVTTPSKKLHVVSAPSVQYDAAIYGSSSPTNNSGYFGAMVYDRGDANFGMYAHSDALSNTSPLGVNRAADGALVNFYSANILEGQITVSGSTIGYGAFTGVHYAELSDNDIERGMLVSLNGNNGNLHNKATSETVYGISKTSVANDSKVMGTYLSLMDPLMKKSADNPVQIMAVGNGDMWIVDNGKNLVVGDYLISSDLPGYAMLDKGEYDVSHIIARIGQNVNWEDVSEKKNGKKVIRVSIFFENFEINHKAQKLVKELDMLNSKISFIKEQQELEITSLKKQMGEIMEMVGTEAKKK